MLIRSVFTLRTKRSKQVFRLGMLAKHFTFIHILLHMLSSFVSPRQNAGKLLAGTVPFVLSLNLKILHSHITMHYLVLQQEFYLESYLKVNLLHSNRQFANSDLRQYKAAC